MKWHDIDILSDSKLIKEFGVSKDGLEKLELDGEKVIVFDYTYYQLMNTKGRGYSTGRYTKKQFKEFLMQNNYCEYREMSTN